VPEQVGAGLTQHRRELARDLRRQLVCRVSHRATHPGCPQYLFDRGDLITQIHRAVSVHGLAHVRQRRYRQSLHLSGLPGGPLGVHRREPCRQFGLQRDHREVVA
jgi:hypothetical protein